MRIPRLYLPGELSQDAEVNLPEEAAHYLTRVLRMDIGRPLSVFNGQGGEYAAEIVAVDKKNTRIRLLNFNADNRTSSLSTHLAIGISKGERFEWVLQKAVELGVSQITPLLTERTEVRVKADRQDKKQDHWQKIVVSSAEQCQCNILPLLAPPTAIEHFIATTEADHKLVLHHRTEQKLTAVATPQSVVLLIGPEGGLSDTEIMLATQANYHPLALGPRVLRTETAPVAALSLVQFLWGDLG